MIHTIERKLRHEVERVQDGHARAIDVARFAFRHGYGGIGTAEHAKGYEPTIVLSARNHNNELVGWHVMYPNERGGVRPLVPISIAPRVAIEEAFGGSKTMPMQRQRGHGRRLVTGAGAYDLGTHGSSPDPSAPDQYRLRMHVDLQAGIEQGYRDDPDAIIGAVDLIRIPDTATLLPRELGILGIEGSVDTVFTLPVRFGDYPTLGQIDDVYHYEPQLS